MYFLKCPKANSVIGRTIRVFAAKSSNLMTEKCPETGSSCWLHSACLSESLSNTEKMYSDESEFSVSYCSSGSEGSGEETDEDYDVVCNQSDVTR